MNPYANPLMKTLARWGGFAALLAVIAATSLHSYVLFHSLVEIFRIVVIFGIAALAWNARSQIDHPFLLVSGLAYPAVGLLELLHTLAYKGMGIFAADANLPTQLWIAFRGYESLAMLIAASLLAWRNLPVAAIALGFLGTGAALGWLVLSGHFPDCFVEGSGLTAFKIGAEYAIAAVFAVALWLI
ncbi:MAG TPA: MASE3 domain-containing protein, partial [Rhodocyclaceae bacterium]